VTGARSFDVEGVHVVARGMVLGDVERFEVVVGRLDFRPFDYRESDGKENALELFVGLADQVAGANRALDARQGKIDLIARGGCAFCCSFEFLALGFQCRFDMRLELLKFLADDRLEFLGCGLEPVVADQHERTRFPADPVR